MQTAAASNEKLQTLWIVTELYYPEETSTGYYLTKIAENLTDLFKVKVVCGQPNYSARGIKAARREIHKKVEINRVFSTTLDKNKIPNRLYNMATLSFSVFFKLLRSLNRGDKLLVVTTPPSLPVIAALAALIKGAGYVLLMHDNYPEILIAGEKLKENSLIAKIFEHLNRWVFKYAAQIIVVGRDMSDLILRKTKGLDILVETIPNWAELEIVNSQPRAENKLLKKLNLENKFVFLYAGNMGYPNDLETIVKAAEKLLETKPHIHFIFLGAGVKRNWLEKKISESKLKNITLLDPRPRTEQTEFLNACDVALVSLVDKMLGVSMPSRTYNIMAAGKPILAITDQASELALVVKEEEIGWITRPKDVEGLIKQISEIENSRSELIEMEKKSRIAAVSKYSMENILRLYRQALK